MKSTDREFIGLQDKKKFANELRALLDNHAFSILIEGMISERLKLMNEMDSFKVKPDVAEQNRMKRTAIKVFLDQIINSILEGERASKEIDRILTFEKDQEQKNYKERSRR